VHRKFHAGTRYGRKDRRGEKTRKMLLDDKENRKYWNFEEEALYCTLLINCIGRGSI
jgi:hypothetical protein